MVDIIPGILEKEWSVIESRIALVAPHVSWVQIDIADNTLVPNQTFLHFDHFVPLATSYPNLSLEAHLMVARPETYIRPLADSGFKRLIAHVEAEDPRLFLDQARYETVEVGMAIDGGTEFEEIEPFLESVDSVLVMTIEMGESGRPFLPETVEKIKAIHRYLPDLPIEVDGGMNEVTAKLARDAGATRIVSTSYLFRDPQRIGAAIEHLKNV